MKRTSLFIAVILSVIPLSSGFVRAADSSSAFDITQSALDTRRQALLTVLALTESETLDFQSRLKSLERPTDPEFALVYDTLAKNLESYLDLIHSRVKELNSGYITLDGILVTADNLKGWREAVYDPGTRELFDFLILQQGGLILSIVESRYEKVALDVEHLKALYAPEKAASFEAMLQDARTRVENAKVLRGEAVARFLSAFRQRHDELISRFAKISGKQIGAARVESVDLTASVIESTLPVMQPAQVKTKTILDTIDLSTATVQTLMQQVVDEITAAYKVFLQMRDLVHHK